MKYLTKLAAMAGLGLALSGCGDLRHPDYRTDRPINIGGDMVQYKEEGSKNIIESTRPDRTKLEHIMYKDQLTLQKVCITNKTNEKRCFNKGDIADKIFTKARPKNEEYLNELKAFNTKKWMGAYNGKKTK